MAATRAVAGLRTAPYDARYPGIVRIQYSLHRFYGQEFPVVGRYRFAGRLSWEIDLGDRRVQIPAWMTDASFCSQLTWGVDAACSVDSLFELLSLLQSQGL